MMKPRLEEIVASIKDTRAELEFQVNRLGKVDTEIAEEREHLEDLRRGYSEAHRYLGVLLNYQEGRLRRAEE